MDPAHDHFNALFPERIRDIKSPARRKRGNGEADQVEILGKRDFIPILVNHLHVVAIGQRGQDAQMQGLKRYVGQEAIDAVFDEPSWFDQEDLHP